MVGKVTEMLENFFATEADFHDCFVVDVHQSNTKLDVFVDSDSGMTFQKCQRISRFLEAYLDEAQPLGESYTLNVSSPGVDRPLKFHRQYVKNVGRTLEVTTVAGEVYKGVLKEVAPDHLVLEAKVRRQEGKRKKTVVEATRLALADIKKSIVKITF